LRQGVAGILIYLAEPMVKMQGDHLCRLLVKRAHRLVATVAGQHIPFVFLDATCRNCRNHVVSDDFAAGYASTQHLVKLGHQRIGFVTTIIF